MAIPMLLTIDMHIRSTRLLEVGFPNIKYDSKWRLRERCTGVDWCHESEIEEAIAARNNKYDNDKDS